MTLAQATEWTNEEWRERAFQSGERVTFVEDGAEGELRAMAVGRFEASTGVASLTGMYVEPESRRSGVFLGSSRRDGEDARLTAAALALTR